MNESLSEASAENTAEESAVAEAGSPLDSYVNSGCLRGERRGSRIKIFKINDTCTCELNLSDMDTGSARKVYPLLAALSKE